jgi:hypothetical protein
MWNSSRLLWPGDSRSDHVGHGLFQKSVAGRALYHDDCSWLFLFSSARQNATYKQSTTSGQKNLSYRALPKLGSTPGEASHQSQDSFDQVSLEYVYGLLLQKVCTDCLGNFSWGLFVDP